MTKNEYMKELENALRRLPKEEREEALSYYREYFEDAGPEKEVEVLEELGDPKVAASQILKDVAIKRLEEPEKAARKGLSTIWIVLLALCAAPVGLPFLFSAVVVCLVMAFVFFVLLAVFLFVGIVLAGSGIASIAAGFYFLPSQLANGLCILGAAFVTTGIGLFLILGGCAICRLIFKGLAGLTKRMLTGGKKR